jgi:hypothetical protein
MKLVVRREHDELMLSGCSCCCARQVIRSCAVRPTATNRWRCYPPSPRMSRSWTSACRRNLITAERLRAAHPKLGLLFLSHYAESHYLMRILEIGTESIGYRLKEKVGSVEV